MKILVVEDHERVLESIKTGLEYKGWVVDTASDGESGLELALSEQYDVIMLDRMLPKVDGLAICRELRSQNIATPILMLTAKSLITDKLAGFETGVDDYLTKPFAFAELVARLQALSRRPRQLESEIIRSGDVSLNQSTGAVFRNGMQIELTKKEFTLLSFLVKNPNQTFSAQQLAERVWSYEADVLPNTAQVYVGYVRKKIDEAFPQLQPRIKTQRGFGYSFIHTDSNPVGVTNTTSDQPNVKGRKP